MLVPTCQCGNDKLILMPKTDAAGEDRVYCAECQANYKLTEASALTLRPVKWVRL